MVAPFCHNQSPLDNPNNLNGMFLLYNNFIVCQEKNNDIFVFYIAKYQIIW